MSHLATLLTHRFGEPHPHQEASRLTPPCSAAKLPAADLSARGGAAPAWAADAELFAIAPPSFRWDNCCGASVIVNEIEANRFKATGSLQQESLRKYADAAALLQVRTGAALEGAATLIRGFNSQISPVPFEFSCFVAAWF